MKIYVVRYRWEEMVEAVYEYIISNCERLFKATNRDRSFWIEPDVRNKCLTVGLMRDGHEQFFKDFLEHHELKETGLYDAQLLSSSGQSRAIRESDRDHDLADEVRYLKLNDQDMSRLLLSIVAELLHMKKFYGVTKQESDLYTVYISRSDFDRKILDKEDHGIKFADKTTEVVGRFV